MRTFVIPRVCIHLGLIILVVVRILLAVPGLLRCCLLVPGQQLYAHLFGSGGPQLLEVVAQAGEAACARAGPHAVGRPIPRYGPPPGSLPLPVFAVDPGRPSTSRQVRSLLEGRLAERPSMDGQILQLAAGELSLAMDRAQVRFQFP
jgi:hypothetical protein